MKAKKYAKQKPAAPMQPMSPKERREAMREDFGRRVDAEKRGRKA